MPPFLRMLLNLGPTNPIAVRIVQNGSKRTRHLYIRSVYLAALILVLLWSLLAMGSGSLDYRLLAVRGAEAFTIVSYLQVGLICVLAPVFMAGAIAQEANPRTWDILLTTPLSGPQIVLGNLIGRLFFILALVLCSLPLFALTQYFGGVPGRAIMASYVVSGVAALVVGSIAIALSVSRLAGRRAVFAFYVSVVTYLAVTAGIDSAVQTSAGRGVTYMTALNPFLSMRAMLSPASYPVAPQGTPGLAGFMLSTPLMAYAVIGVAVSALLVAGSTLTVRTGGLANLGAGKGAPWYRRVLKLGAAGTEHRPPRTVWFNPIAWREAAARNGTMGRILARWSFILAGALFGLGIVMVFHTGVLDASTFRTVLLTTVWAEIGVIVLVAINMSATAISREREDGTLDILLTTPITPKQYLSGKLRGLVAYLLPMFAVPVFTLLCASVYVITGGLGGTAEIERTVTTTVGPVSAPVVLIEAPLLLVLSAGPFVAFCVMVGLQWSLKSKGTIASVVGAVGVVGIVAVIAGGCGWKSASELALIGPAIGALNPVSQILAFVEPVTAMGETINAGRAVPGGVTAGESGLTNARIALAVGSVGAAAIYAGLVYAMRSSMVRGFDDTVRRLSGIK